MDSHETGNQHDTQRDALFCYQRGAVVWLTGLSGCGKSTVGRAISRESVGLRLRTCLLDADELRSGINADLRFTDQDRRENVRRIAHIARLFAQEGYVAIVAVISPLREHRITARAIVEGNPGGLPFYEVYLSAPLSVCENRDPKHL